MLEREFGQTGVWVPVIGQGTWEIGEHVKHERREIEALQLGLDLGMTHIDTAEMYGSGRAEALVGRAIAGRRHEVFLASKVLPSNASYQGTLRACERSLTRLQTDYLDLYLLHWWSDAHPVEETMRAMEDLVQAGKVRFVGVSNFTINELQRAQRALTRERMACNQVCYHVRSRGIEFSLLPHCQREGIAVVGYSPFGQGNFPSSRSRQARALAEVGSRYERTARQVALRFLVRAEGVFTIPKAGRAEHVRENAGSLGWDLSGEDLAAIDKVCPPPRRERPLDMI